MVITGDRERGTIRALRETQKGGELPLVTIYIYISIPYWLLPVVPSWGEQLLVLFLLSKYCRYVQPPLIGRLDGAAITTEAAHGGRRHAARTRKEVAVAIKQPDCPV